MFWFLWIIEFGKKQATEVCHQWYKYVGWQTCYGWNCCVNFTHRPTFGLIEATCHCLKSINVVWLLNDIRRASIDRPSLTPTAHPWPDHTLPYSTSHNQIIESLLIYLNILIFKNSTHRQTNGQTDRQNYQQTFGLIEATCRDLKMKNGLHTVPWNEFFDMGKMTERDPTKICRKNKF